jgi:hypothetical protein
MLEVEALSTNLTINKFFLLFAVDVSATWKYILVECPGFATVRFDNESGLCTTEFGLSGPTVDCLPSDGGSYTIYPSFEGSSESFGMKGCLRIDTDGTAIYYPSQAQNGSTVPFYVMRHSDDVILETVDADGCHYFATRTGDNHIGVTEETSFIVGSAMGEPHGSEDVLRKAASKCSPTLRPPSLVLATGDDSSAQSKR